MGVRHTHYSCDQILVEPGRDVQIFVDTKNPAPAGILLKMLNTILLMLKE